MQLPNQYRDYANDALETGVHILPIENFKGITIHFTRCISEQV